MGLSPQAWARLSLLLALALAAVYALLWGMIDFLMERAFSLHIWDVGANYVLTAGTSPPDLDYGHLIWAPQNLVYLLFVPLVRVVPDPMAIVYAEDVLMAVGGVFVYLLAVDVWQRRGLALLLEGLYLFNYALVGAPFYPNHFEILFSVFFPIAFFLHRRNRPALSFVFLVLAALCSSLAAVTAALFIVLLLAPRFIDELRGRGIGMVRFVTDHIFLFLGGIAATGVFLIPFLTVGPAVTLSYAHLAGNPASPDVSTGVSSYVGVKLVYLGLLLLPFVPWIFRSRFWMLSLPYVALLLVAGSDHYSQFWYQYTYNVGAVLFIAYIESLRVRYGRVPISPPSRPARTRRSTPRPWRLPRGLKGHPELLQMTLLVVGIGSIALPYSPGNAWAGPYYSVPFHNYHFATLTTATTYDRALWDMSLRIPMDASVLIQENMPMLTNRAEWYEPGSYHGELVDYILTDPSTLWFTFTPPAFIGPYPTPMIDSVNGLLAAGSYGILEEYQGAVLYERGYQGPPQSWVPYLAFEPGEAFVGPHVTRAYAPPGSISVTNLTNGTLAFRTQGLMVVPPGMYSLTFWMRSGALPSSNHAMVGLWTNDTAPRPVATITLDGSEFTSNSTWVEFTTSFSLSSYVQDCFFGAYNTDWSGTLALRSVYLNQTWPIA